MILILATVLSILLYDFSSIEKLKINMHSPTHFIPVTTHPQIEDVATLAQQIWQQHFTPIIGSAQVAYMLDKFQSTKAISHQIDHEQFLYYLLKRNGIAVGYTGFKLHNDLLFLSKLYIHADYRRQGVGRAAIEFITSKAKKAGASFIRLTVNRHNLVTIKAYKRCGFVIADEVVADIGNGFVMDDYVMEKVICS